MSSPVECESPTHTAVEGTAPLADSSVTSSSGNLDGEDHAAERTLEDVFLRKFMLGTFPGCLADQIVLKRRANQVDICAVVLRQLPAHKFYFLVGYSETLLSHLYKCPVRLHLQTVPSKVVYKYI